jgi:hypothetical protein
VMFPGASLIAADRDLLFGLLALQNGLIQQGQIVAAFHAWTCNKSRSLADHLLERGDLTLPLPTSAAVWHVPRRSG